jgi:hypothetical protein
LIHTEIRGDIFFVKANLKTDIKRRSKTEIDFREIVRDDGVGWNLLFSNGSSSPFRAQTSYSVLYHFS